MRAMITSALAGFPRYSNKASAGLSSRKLHGNLAGSIE